MNIFKNALYSQIVFLNDNASNLEKSLDGLMNQVQKYMNIVLGAIAGILTLVICIITAIAFFKAGKTDNEEQRQAQLKKIKWIVIFLIAVILIWAIEGSIVAILKTTLSSGASPNGA